MTKKFVIIPDDQSVFKCYYLPPASFSDGEIARADLEEFVSEFDHVRGCFPPITWPDGTIIQPVYEWQTHLIPPDVRFKATKYEPLET